MTGNYFRELDEHISRWFTPVIKWMVYICCGVDLIAIIFRDAGGYIIAFLAASVEQTIMHGMIWQLVTYAFVHGSFSHLFFNLLALYFFGTRLEQRWGSDKFIRFSLFVIIGSALTHLLGSLLLSRINIMYGFGPMIGISGLVYGILLVSAIYDPDQLVYLYAILPIKIKYLVFILGLVAFLSSYEGQGGIAHLAHLGGLLFGWLFVRFPDIFDRWRLPSLRKKARGPQFGGPTRWRDL